MTFEDLGLLKTNGVYSLSAPTDDAEERMKNRFSILFLSDRCDGRGSTFVSELRAGRINTNADILTIFALTASQIITYMRGLNYDIYPYRASLDDFEFVSSLTVNLQYTLHTNDGDVEDNVVATVE